MEARGYAIGSRDAVENMIDIVDGLIGEFEARGWLQVASVAEQLICEIYSAADIEVPTERVEIIEKMLRHDLSRRRSS